MNAWLRIYKMWLRCAYKRCCAYLQPNLSAERTSAYFNSYHFLTFSSSTSKHYDNLNWKWNIFSNFKYISPKKILFFLPQDSRLVATSTSILFIQYSHHIILHTQVAKMKRCNIFFESWWLHRTLEIFSSI